MFPYHYAQGLPDRPKDKCNSFLEKKEKAAEVRIGNAGS
jgi:hypothetical protein